MNKYEEGKQPCQAFKPKRDGNGYAEWDNVHCCYGPYDDSLPKHRCAATVSFCENCYSDHHACGWNTCPTERHEEDGSEHLHPKANR